MKVLQIACGVCYTKIYKNLFSALKQNGTEFEVYVPQHISDSVPTLTHEEFPFPFYANKIIKPYDKFLYFTKINKMMKDVESNFNLSKVSLIHAHSLFSDGAVAFEIYKKYKIPYIVAVRDTDVNQYFHKAIHLRKRAINILKNASNIVFLSKTYRDYVLKKYVPIVNQDEIRRKTLVIPNGIEEFWLSNKNNDQTEVVRERIQILFVGQIIKRKNLVKIIEATNILGEKYRRKVNLILIGAKKDEDYFNNLSKIGSFKYISFLPKDKLITYYRESDVFVMPSLTETFGLVYVEAMSQGLPVIYSKGQGFDGQFKEGEVGYSVDPLNAQDIAQKIEIVLSNREEISQNCIKNADVFNWDMIGKEYKNIYTDIFINSNLQKDIR